MVGLLATDVVEDFDEVFAGFYGIALEAVKVDGTVMVVFDVEVVAVGGGYALHDGADGLFARRRSFGNGG